MGSRLSGLDVKAVGESLTEARFLKLTVGYEVAILDGAPRRNDIARLAAMASDIALIPLRVGGFNWWASEQTLKLLDGVEGARRASRPSPAPAPGLRAQRVPRTDAPRAVRAQGAGAARGGGACPHPLA